MKRRLSLLALPALLTACPAIAQVDEGLIVQPVIPQGFSRGRNVSVLEQPRPDYSPLGVPVGGFKLFPTAEIAGGATSNTYLTSKSPTASAFASVEGGAQLVSQWSRHSLEFSGDVTQRDYIGQSQRNENIWNLDANGELDVYHSFNVTADVNASRDVENLFEGEVTPTVAALSRFRRTYFSIKPTYTEGRIRAFVVLDHADFTFSDVPLLTGGTLDQSDRDRQITRLTGQFEYARTPSFSLFGQLSGGRVSYDRDLRSGAPNLDSKSVRLLGGANLDIAGLIRGTIGIGYSIRDYDASIYKSVRGLSVETQLEFFLIRRLTIGLSSERTIEDASIGSRSAYWNTRFRLRGDYDLLHNAIVSASVEYLRQSYIGRPLESDTYGASASLRYLVSRRVSLRATVNYSQRFSNDAAVLGSLKEGRVEAGISYHL